LHDNVHFVLLIDLYYIGLQQYRLHCTSLVGRQTMWTDETSEPAVYYNSHATGNSHPTRQSRSTYHWVYCYQWL